MAATDPWGDSLEYDPERDEATDRLASLSDSELVELFGTRPTVDPADIPPEALGSPTLGAVRRAKGIPDEDSANPFAHVCEEARVTFAWELCQEAMRRVLLERLDSIMEFIAVGATPDQAIACLRGLLAECQEVAA